MPEYSILIQFNKSDNIYIARVLELNGCMAHGKTQEEAVKELKIALELWIDELTDSGMEIPEPIFFTDLQPLLSV